MSKHHANAGAAAAAAAAAAAGNLKRLRPALATSLAEAAALAKGRRASLAESTGTNNANSSGGSDGEREAPAWRAAAVSGAASHEQWQAKLAEFPKPFSSIKPPSEIIGSAWADDDEMDYSAVPVFGDGIGVVAPQDEVSSAKPDAKNTKNDKKTDDVPGKDLSKKSLQGSSSKPQQPFRSSEKAAQAKPETAKPISAAPTNPWTRNIPVISEPVKKFPEAEWPKETSSVWSGAVDKKDVRSPSAMTTSGLSSAKAVVNSSSTGHDAVSVLAPRTHQSQPRTQTDNPPSRRKSVPEQDAKIEVEKTVSEKKDSQAAVESPKEAPFVKTPTTVLAKSEAEPVVSAAKETGTSVQVKVGEKPSGKGTEKSFMSSHIEQIPLQRPLSALVASMEPSISSFKARPVSVPPPAPSPCDDVVSWRRKDPVVSVPRRSEASERGERKAPKSTSVSERSVVKKDGEDSKAKEVETKSTKEADPVSNLEIELKPVRPQNPVILKNEARPSNEASEPNAWAEKKKSEYHGKGGAYVQMVKPAEKGDEVTAQSSLPTVKMDHGNSVSLKVTAGPSTSKPVKHTSSSSSLSVSDFDTVMNNIKSILESGTRTPLPSNDSSAPLNKFEIPVVEKGEENSVRDSKVASSSDQSALKQERVKKADISENWRKPVVVVSKDTTIETSESKSEASGKRSLQHASLTGTSSANDVAGENVAGTVKETGQLSSEHSQKLSQPQQFNSEQKASEIDLGMKNSNGAAEKQQFQHQSKAGVFSAKAQAQYLQLHYQQQQLAQLYQSVHYGALYPTSVVGQSHGQAMVSPPPFVYPLPPQLWMADGQTILHPVQRLGPQLYSRPAASGAVSGPFTQNFAYLQQQQQQQQHPWAQAFALPVVSTTGKFLGK